MWYVWEIRTLDILSERKILKGKRPLERTGSR
jgi:hypothetical protein